MSSSLNLKIRRQEGFCTTLEADIANFSGRTVCTIPGLEFLIPPFPAQAVLRDGKNQRTNQNDVMVFNGSEEHTEEYHNNSGRLTSVVINHSYLQSSFEPLGINGQELIFDKCELRQSQDLVTPLSLLASLNNEAIEPSAFSLDCFISSILLKVLSGYQHTFSNVLKKNIESGQYPTAVDRMKYIIRDHLLNPAFDLDFLARESGMSKFHLIRHFSRITGISPAKYRMKIKIDLVKERLLYSSQSILEIATELEFQNLSTFNKAFKNETGLSPTQFRKLK